MHISYYFSRVDLSLFGFWLENIWKRGSLFSFTILYRVYIYLFEALSPLKRACGEEKGYGLLSLSISSSVSLSLSFFELISHLMSPVYLSEKFSLSSSACSLRVRVRVWVIGSLSFPNTDELLLHIVLWSPVFYRKVFKIINTPVQYRALVYKSHVPSLGSISISRAACLTCLISPPFSNRIFPCSFS